MKRKLGFDSLCVQETAEKRTTKPQQLPIYATSSFAFESIDEGIEIFTGRKKGHVYGRYGNPTLDAVADKIAKLECFGLEVEAEAMLVSSGMAAISTLLMGLLQQGDKILTQSNLYGGTTELFNKIFQPLGIKPIMSDLQHLETVENYLKRDKSIKVIYFETPANPTLACVDMEAIVALSRKYQVKTAVDNTFCTPYLQQPFQYGVDYIIHSTTKYLNGHGNSIAGAIIGTDKAMMQGRIWQVMKLAGTNCNPFDAWLTYNGLKTLALRMEKHSTNAMTIAQFLENHKKISKVNYVGLPSHPDYALAQKQMRLSGGMLSFELKGGLKAGMKMMNKVKFCALAPTLGDVETLILHPASMSHLNIAKEVREAAGITDGLIRLSVGIETVEDIIADLDQAI